MGLRERVDADAELSAIRERLKNVGDSYVDFVEGLLVQCIVEKGYSDILVKYLDEHPDADTSEIIENTVKP